MNLNKFTEKAQEAVMLEAVTRRLLEIEVMEGDQLRQLMGIAPPAPSTETVPLPTNELR